MDEVMGRRTASGLLVTKGGSILLFREESPRHKASACCTRLGCSSKLFPNKDRKIHKTSKETSVPHQRSQVLRKSNRMSPQGSISYDGSTGRNVASTFGEADNKPRRRENAGRDLLARLKERVNASRKRSLSEGSSPCLSPSNTSNSGSISSSRSISRSICRPASRMRKDGGRVAEAVRMHRVRDSSGSNREDVRRNSNQDPSGRCLSRSLFRHRSGIQRGPESSFEDSLDDSNEYWRFDMDESEEVEDYYVFNDRHRGMRMDIDDMSYEELLALGERIGTVSTGLSDGALSECLKRSIYGPTTSTSHEDGDLKCIICQEEYFSGVEVAKMACEHYYHVPCIQQWLGQKNWCPICKSVASAVSS